MEVVLASSNIHKANEMTSLLPSYLNVSLQSDLGIHSPAETGSTFVENALIKARNASALSKLPAIADDSGLCVRALTDRPGIISARYSGESATDEENFKKLLAELGNCAERQAFFHCVLVFLDHATSPTPIIAEASWHGEISHTPSGNGGFGYDPVFYVHSLDATAAEISTSLKNTLSHRGKALRQLKEKLLEYYSP